ncbi:ribonuclease HII [Glaciecola sp. 1036]|uniref:ribonuclease HII n=1 Tax=Alteromonadaceae TaxID=72275 RepID=UPI003D04BB61
MLVAGVDEVGRGPLVGDVVAAAVILDPSQPIEGLRDSKKLSEKKRNILDQEIRQKALAWAIGRASPIEIDKINILHASMLAMQRAVDALSISPEHILVDGNRLPVWGYSAQAIVKGDDKHPEIAAASIIAKVARDHDMMLLDQAFPNYDFAKHKGYPTKVHLAKLAEYGPLDIHRKSFKPVQQLITKKG